MRTALDLNQGEKAQILHVHGEGPLKRRFADLGILPGSDITYIKPAPLGDPVEIEVKGVRLAIRKDSLTDIEVIDLD